MDVLLLGLAFDIFSALSLALSTLFSIFMTLASTSTSIINTTSIMNNIYIIMSVIMLFYITINLLTYLVNPEKLTDKTSGGSKIVIKVIITLALLILTPVIFTISRDLQSAILEENILGRVILSNEDKMNDENFKDVSHSISEVLVRAFLTPKRELGESDPMYDALFFSGATSMTELRTIVQDTVNYNFNWIMAIGCTVVLCLIVFGFLFDVAIRVIKLMFMELIAPIPIISNIIPSKKNNMLSNWVKNTASTYISLFIRISVIFFFLYCITNIDISISGDAEKGIQGNPVIYTFVIIGALLFAKQLPKLLEDIFGIKLDGSFSLNPMTRIREVPLLGSAVQTAGAAIGGFATGASLGYKAGGFGMAAKMGGLGFLSGGRAGFNQTKLMGVAAKEQKIDKTAYNAGASAVAQAITGSDKASAGFGDRFFNNIGTKLNEPAYKQGKVIEDAKKDYEKAFEELSVLKNSEREIASNLGVTRAQTSAYGNQLSAFDNQIAALENSRDLQIEAETQPLEQNLQLKISSRDQDIINSHAMYDRLISDVQSSRTQRIDTMNSAIDSEINNLMNTMSNTTDTATILQCSDRITALRNQRANVEVTVDEQIRNEVNAYQQQRASVETTIDNNISSLQNEIIHRRDEITNNFAQQIDTVRAERETVARNYTVSHEKEIELQTQHDNINIQINDQTEVVAAAKQNIKDQKDKLKDLQGKYKKNE